MPAWPRARGGGCLASTPPRVRAAAEPGTGVARIIVHPGCRKSEIPWLPPAPRRRASFKPSRALGHAGPPAAASLNPRSKFSFLTVPSHRRSAFFCSLPRGPGQQEVQDVRPVCQSAATVTLLLRPAPPRRLPRDADLHQVARRTNQGPGCGVGRHHRCVRTARARARERESAGSTRARPPPHSC